VATAALKLRELVIIPQLASCTAQWSISLHKKPAFYW
jgi:hypothetical protein